MLSRNLDKALQAYKSRNAELSRHAHDRPRDEALEEHQQAQGQYIKSMVYGGLDGIVTTFAVVAGVAGASLSAGVVLIMGFANLVADGLSMAIGDFLSTKAEQEYNRAEREREAWEVENYPEGEKREMVELYTARGMDPGDARAVTEVLARNKQAWVSVMMAEELGIVESERVAPGSTPWPPSCPSPCSASSPWPPTWARASCPRSPAAPSPLSIALTGLTLFVLGALKSRFTRRSWLAGGRGDARRRRPGRRRGLRDRPGPFPPGRRLSAVPAFRQVDDSPRARHCCRLPASILTTGSFVRQAQVVLGEQPQGLQHPHLDAEQAAEEQAQVAGVAVTLDSNPTRPPVYGETLPCHEVVLESPRQAENGVVVSRPPVLCRYSKSRERANRHLIRNPVLHAQARSTIRRWSGDPTEVPDVEDEPSRSPPSPSSSRLLGLRPGGQRHAADQHHYQANHDPSLAFHPLSLHGLFKARK